MSFAREAIYIWKDGSVHTEPEPKPEKEPLRPEMFSKEWYAAIESMEERVRRAEAAAQQAQERVDEALAKDDTATHYPDVSIRFRLDPITGEPIYLNPADEHFDERISRQEIALQAHRTAADARIKEELSRIDKIVLGVLSAAVIYFVGPSVAGQIGSIVQQNSFLKSMWAKLLALEPAYRKIKERLDTEANRIRGIINSRLVQNSLRVINTLHTVGKFTSQRYRNFLDTLYKETRLISKQVFGEATELSSALGLLRLAISDATALSGKRRDIGEKHWFTESIRLTNYVEANASRYAQRPEEFYSDLNIFFIDPALEEARAANESRWGGVDTIREGLVVADKATEHVADRFDDYRKELDVFLSPEHRRELDNISRNFDKDIRTPLRGVTSFVETEWPKIELKVSAIEGVTNLQQEEINAVTELTNDPETLDQEAQQLQQTRFSRILGSGLPADSPVADLSQAIEDVAFIKRELPVN